MLENLFPHCSPITASAPQATPADFPAIPAKPAVYLLTGPASTDLSDPTVPHIDNQKTKIENPSSPIPLLLATVGAGGLRAALQRRLADTPPDTKSKRIAYAQIATQVHYRVVHSTFAANYYYAQAAHALFPNTAQALVPWATPTASWWLAVERPGGREAGLGGAATPFPRIRKTNSLADPDLLYAGPIRDKHAANRLVESLEDLFDLCRYHSILVQAPHGKACAYKEMKKCPAPCDGTIPLSAYHQQIADAWSYLTNSGSSPAASARLAWTAAVEKQMKSAAARLEFETANRLKQRLARADFIHHEAFAHVAPLHHFSYLSLQPGKGKPWIEPWLIHGPHIQPLPQFHRKDLPQAAQFLAAHLQQLPPMPLPPTPWQASQIALVAHHLFSRPQKPSDLWLALHQLPSTLPEVTATLLAAIETFHTQRHPAHLIEQSTDAEIPSPSDPSTPSTDSREDPSSPLTHPPKKVL